MDYLENEPAQSDDIDSLYQQWCPLFEKKEKELEAQHKKDLGRLSIAEIIENLHND